MWESLLNDGQYQPDPWILHETRKNLDLERFQIEVSVRYKVIEQCITLYFKRIGPPPAEKTKNYSNSEFKKQRFWAACISCIHIKSINTPVDGLYFLSTLACK